MAVRGDAKPANTQAPAVEKVEDPSVETEFIPVTDGEETETIIEEGTLSSQLKSYRDQLVAALYDSYNQSFLNVDE